jgi:NAD(P)H-nitrite reductase large subunit
MTNRIGIVGAGHAGIEAAAAVRQAGVDVTVFSNENVPPYFRPRLPAVAMGQTEPDAIAMHPPAWYAERGIELRLDAAVTSVAPQGCRLTAAGAEIAFDALLLCCGALPIRPRFPGEPAGLPVFTLWSLADALAVRPRARPGAHLAVIGGGMLGIECALRGRERQMSVTLIEKAPRLLPCLFGDGASTVLNRLLADRAVDTRLGAAVETLRAADGGRVRIGTDDGRCVDADFVLVCIGAGANSALARQAGLRVERGVVSDANLQAAAKLFSAGDVCQVGERVPRGTAREALAQGRLAAQNSLAALAGRPLQPFAFTVSAVSLRCAGVEVHAAGRAGGAGVFEQRLDDGSRPGVCQILSRLGPAIVGVQMVGTREGFDELVAQTAT